MTEEEAEAEVAGPPISTLYLITYDVTEDEAVRRLIVGDENQKVPGMGGVYVADSTYILECESPSDTLKQLQIAAKGQGRIYLLPLLKGARWCGKDDKKVTNEADIARLMGVSKTEEAPYTYRRP